MASSSEYDITNVDLSDNRYTIEQSLVRNKYKLLDSDGETVLKGKQKMFKMAEEFPFTNGEGEDAFTVKAEGMLDIAGSYTLTDSVTGEDVVVLDEDISLFAENWTIRDANTGDALARVESKNRALSVLRHLSDLANFVPNKYEIFDANGNKIGEIAGQLTMKDTYEVTINEASEVPGEAVLASACVIDALENK